MAHEASFDEAQMKSSGISSLDDDDLWSVIKNQYDVWLEITRDLRRQWRMNTLFARGIQWAVFDVTGRIVIPKPPPGKVMLTKNLILPWLKDTEAKLDIEIPTFEVVPNTTHPEHKEAAVAGENSGQHYWRLLKIRRRARMINRLRMHHGGCLAALDWDKTIGPKTLVTSPVVNPNTNEPQQRIETEGDIRLDLFSQFRWFSDELPGELDDKLWFGTISWMSLDRIDEIYNKEVEPEQHTAPMDDHLEAIMQQSSARANIRRDQQVKGATLFKWYMRPQKSNNNQGLVVTAANGTIIERKPWPAAFAKLTGQPAVKFDWYESPEQFRSASPIEEQIPMQREINITLSQVVENKNAMAVLKYLNPIGSGVESVTDIAGQIINHTPGLPISFLQPPNLPQYVFRHGEDIELGLEDVQIYHKPSKGKVPAGVKSGVGISLLQEQDDRPLSVPEGDMHEQLSLLFRKILQIVSVAVSEERMLRFVGPNKRRNVMAFKGSDLRDNTNIHLSVVSGASKSKAGVQQTFVELLRVGAFRREDGQPDTDKMREVMRYAIPDMLYEDMDANEELARDENDQLDDPKQPFPNPMEWEDHRRHLDIQEEHMLSSSWRRRAAENPAILERHVRHRELTLQFLFPPQPTLDGAQQDNVVPMSQPSGGAGGGGQ